MNRHKNHLSLQSKAPTEQLKRVQANSGDRLSASHSFLRSKWPRVVTGLLALTTFVCFLAVIGCGRKDTAKAIKQEPLLIGVILPLTGEASSYGVDCRKGVELAASLSDQNVQFVFEDSKAEPKQAVTAVQRLLGQRHVTAIIGDMFSSTTLAIAPIAQQEGVVLVTPTAAALDIPATGDMVYTIYPTSKFEGEFMAQYVLRAGLKRVGVLAQQFQAAEELATAFSRSLSNNECVAVYTELFPTGTKDFRSLVATIRPKVVDAIFVSAYGQEASLLIQQAREAGITTIFLSQSSLYDQKLLKEFAGALEGTVFSAPFYTDTTDTPEALQFRNAYKTKFGSDPSVWSAYGFDAATLVSTSVSKHLQTGKPLNATIQIALMEGATGPLSFNPDRTAKRSMSLFAVRKGEFIAVSQHRP